MIKFTMLFILFLTSNLIFSQDGEWIKTEGEITEIAIHRSKRLMKASGLVKFNLENGEEIMSSVELIRIPFYGCLNAVGDKITIKYNQQNPGLVQTPLGHFLFNYGMYILILLGIIFSIKPFLKMRKKTNNTAA
ncbi:MAG: DUF3592 domain-containing protein [Crocinitomicaceae bacterium]